MIVALSIEHLFLLVSGLSVLALAVMWARQIWCQVAGHWEPSGYRICHCPKCQYHFFVWSRRALVICPACDKRIRVRSDAKRLDY